MSNDQKAPVFHFDGDEPEMKQACQRARSTFRLFWRELSWEYRRIIPALELTAVKTAFSDRPLNECGPQDHVEQMWLTDIEFNGRSVTGRLINQPHKLKSIKENDTCSFPFEHLTDWMYVSSRRVYGAFTVNLIRSRMNPTERKKHDEAWGLEFGDPAKISLSLFGPTEDSSETEHPMCVNAGPSITKEIQKNPGVVNQPDKRGWTQLHRESLAGNALMVEILLKHDADQSLQTNEGDLPIDLARLMRWQKIVNLLSA